VLLELRLAHQSFRLFPGAAKYQSSTQSVNRVGLSSADKPREAFRGNRFYSALTSQTINTITTKVPINPYPNIVASRGS